MNPLFLRLIYFKRCIDLRNFAIRHTFEIKYGKFNRELIFTRYFCGVVYPTTISVCLETIHRCPSITFYLFLFAFTAPDFNLVLSSAMIWTTYFMATEFFRNWFTVDFSSICNPLRKSSLSGQLSCSLYRKQVKKVDRFFGSSLRRARFYDLMLFESMGFDISGQKLHYVFFMHIIVKQS